MKSWPFEQARALLQRVGDEPRLVTFATGYGPSGPPHIGTFAEVVRTNMVRNAFREITQDRYPTRLIVFSDDYDAMRRVPDTVPEEARERMEEQIGLPLSEVEDPIDDGRDFASFAHRNNAALVEFIRAAGIEDFTFMSASEQYQSGAFDGALLNVLRNYDAVMGVMLPTLGEERRATYSPFLPRDNTTGHILQVPLERFNPESDIGRALFRLPNGDALVLPVVHGNTKLQWKVDWAMRWGALDVDYEMSGKDLIDSVKASSKIARILGHQPPVSMTYELFLDEQGRKISKSLGNGVSVEEWLQYGTRESLAQFMFQNPRAAKNIHLGLIPAVTDEYLKNLGKINQDQVAGSPESFDNPAWHIHQGDPPAWSSDVSYALLVNLASVSNATEPEVLREYLATYRSIADEDRPIIDELLPRVIRYCERFVYPNKVLREPSEFERVAFGELADRLGGMEIGLSGEDYQFEVYEIGKAAVARGDFAVLRDWFKAIYEVIFGASDGPRFGTFVAAYGLERSVELIRSRI